MSLSHPPTAATRVLSPGAIVRAIVARARFLLLLGGVLGVMAAWPVLANYWDKWTRPHKHGGAISSDTEYWCPMCPGVVSDWSTKCPVCNMSLVRRKKGEMTPLPDGVVARVQLSPYRVQLAGIRTAPVEYRRLENEIVLAGRIQPDLPPNTPYSGPALRARWSFQSEVHERDLPFLKVGQEISVACASLAGEMVQGRIAFVGATSNGNVIARVEIWSAVPRGDIKTGTFASAKVIYAVARTELVLRQNREHLVERAALAPLINPQGAAMESLVDRVVLELTTRAGLTLSVPESAVIDMGSRKVVYTESMPGMYDAVEVKLARRCGDYFPVFSGVSLGQQVATAGAVLLDAETRLNPSLAASYFGAGKRTSSGVSNNATASFPQSAPSGGAPEASDEALINHQKICPVTGEPLDSMGGPVKVDLDGKAIFVCCKSCEKPLRKKPAEYLSKLPK